MRTIYRLTCILLFCLPAAAGPAAGCGDSTSSPSSTSSTTSTSTSPTTTGSTSGTGGNGGSLFTTGGGGQGGNGGTSTTGGPGGAGGTAGASATTTTTTTTSGGPTQLAPCQGHVYECGDLIDNDNDGLVDSDDPDCLGPCDNTEGSYFPNIPGQNNAPCKADCYFDQDTGPGNDDCYWDHHCDPHEVSPNYYPESNHGDQCAYDANANIPGTNKTCPDLFNAQSDACLAYCGPLTPNGCDCFGCCELPAGSKTYVWLGSVDGAGNGTCDIAHVNDPSKCQPCLPVKACLNECAPCELCIGKDTLPPECYPDGGSGSSSSGGGGSGSGSSGAGGSGSGSSGGGGSGSSSSGGVEGQCPAGVQACGLPGQAPCPLNAYCITGCCQKIPT
ncbi:MAG: hypothetical protein U0359_35360 [Byssovorax sp.]